MKVTVFFKRIGRDDLGLVYMVPMYESGHAALGGIGVGEIRQVEIKNPRNLKLHNLFMAQLRIVVNNSEKWRSVDHLLAALKMALGLFDQVDGIEGKITMLRSISFESMDEDEFREKVFDPAQQILADELGITVDQLSDPDNWEYYL